MNKNLGILSLLIVSFIISGSLVFLIFSGFFEEEKGLSIQDIAQRSLAYVNAGLINGGKMATLESVVMENGLVKMRMKMENAGMVAYATLDGKMFFQSGIDLTNKVNYPYIIAKDLSVQAQEDIDLSPQNLADFIKCLKKSGFVIYGTNWCFYTSSLVSKFGGFDNLGDIYVDCDQNKNLCDKNKITGYPTVFIGGKEFNDLYNLNNFSKATGCNL